MRVIGIDPGLRNLGWGVIDADGSRMAHVANGIVHGKGDSRTERERASILKGCTDHWLRQLEVVQAFHSAQPRHGGTGAVYVLLRKSEEKKRENREQFSKGRVPYDPA